MGKPLKVLVFDLMGTCLDWHSGLIDDLHSILPAREFRPKYSAHLALAWRQSFFDEIHTRFEAGLPLEDIDETHRRTLTKLLEGGGDVIDTEGVERCVRAWHSQKAWPDVTRALPVLKESFDVIVLANGTTRLQLDITRSAGLDFNMLLSSELLGMTKPDPAIYQRAMELLKCKPEECLMIAAHAYDLRAAKKVGMRTAYICRWTEDREEDMEQVRAENDYFIDDAGKRSEGGDGLMALAPMLGIEVYDLSRSG